MIRRMLGQVEASEILHVRPVAITRFKNMDIRLPTAGTGNLYGAMKSSKASFGLSGAIEGREHPLATDSSRGSDNAADDTVASEGFKYASSPSKSAAVTEFLAFSQMSFADFVRMRYLEKHGLTEDDLKSMPSDQREAIQKEIAEDIKRELTGGNSGDPLSGDEPAGGQVAARSAD